MGHCLTLPLVVRRSEKPIFRSLIEKRHGLGGHFSEGGGDSSRPL